MVIPTQSQIEIRDHDSLDLLVIAPAGCGKTEALALRIKGLIDRRIVLAPRRILVTTFSNRAKDNVRDRLRDYLAPSVMRDRISISNFHGISARIFRAHANVIDLDPQMLLPESDWVGDQCRHRNLSYDAAAEVHRILQSAKQQANDDHAVSKILENSGNAVAIEIEQLRRAESRLTYDDLPRLAELILANVDVADLYRSHFAAVIVDEFQDLTPQQLRIVRRIGYKKTTFAGDLAQGIYSFAGARPSEVNEMVRSECSAVVEFAESHRSAPAVLQLANTLVGLTDGQILTCAEPTAWPSEGLTAKIAHASADEEANYAVGLARRILGNAPNHRVAIISRSGTRRRFVDAAVASTDMPFHRWDDGVLDTDTAKVMRNTLSTFAVEEYRASADHMAHLRQVSNIELIDDPSGRSNLADALSWCQDLLDSGLAPAEISERIRIGDDATLLDIPGVHLLTGHVGKGQQFDWVIVVGTEKGSIPDFHATTNEQFKEEARVLAVMLTRARHGVIIMWAQEVPALNGRVWTKEPSEFWAELNRNEWSDIDEWIASADWRAISQC
ncbi:MAG: ATP-dependent helicase [Acidimicrobiales bacterium]